MRRARAGHATHPTHGEAHAAIYHGCDQNTLHAIIAKQLERIVHLQRTRHVAGARHMQQATENEHMQKTTALMSRTRGSR